MAKPIEIYQFFADQGEPFSLPGEWPALKTPPEFFEMKLGCDELLERLKKKFSIEDLCAAGVCQVKGDEVLTNQLLAMRAPMCKLTCPNQREPEDVVGEGHISLSCHLAFVKLLDNFWVKNLINGMSRLLIVVPDMRDVAALRAARVPALAASNLLGLKREVDLDWFRCSFRIESHGREGNVEKPWPPLPKPGLGELSDPIYITLADWSPSRLDGSSSQLIKHLAEEFRNLDQFFGLYLPPLVNIWQPTEQDLEGIRCTVASGSERFVLRALKLSLEHSTQPLIAPRRPASYAAAAREWASIRNDNVSANAKALAWQTMKELHDAEVTGPLYTAASETDNPIRRSQLMALAELSQLRGPLMQGVIANLEMEIAGIGSRSQGSQSGTGTEFFKMLMATMSQEYKIHHDLKAKRKPKRAGTRPGKRSLPTPDQYWSNRAR